MIDKPIFIGVTRAENHQFHRLKTLSAGHDKLRTKSTRQKPERGESDLFVVSRHQHLTPIKPVSDLPVVFTHIPKTAGTTLDRIFEALEYRCGLSRHRIRGTIYGQFLGPGKPDVAATTTLPTDFKQASVISGHTPFGFPSPLPSPNLKLTILREPLARSISHFLFGAERGGWDLKTEPAAVYAAGQMVDNPQVRQIAGSLDAGEVCDAAMLNAAIANIDDHFDFAGITERFDDLLMALLCALDLPDVVYRKATVGRRPPPKLSRKLSAAFESFNQFDKALYDHVAAKPSPVRDGILAIGTSPANRKNADKVLITNPFINLGGMKYPLFSRDEFSEVLPELRKAGFRVSGMTANTKLH